MKKYEEPQVEIVELTVNDVITTSEGNMDLFGDDCF